MPKVKKPKTKQKQKQRQSQKVVVNIHTGTSAGKRKASTQRKPRSSGVSSGSSGGGNYVAYQSPIPYQTQIVNDSYIPQQFQNIPTITMPTRALENIPTYPTITYPTSTQLQTNTEDVRPFNTGSVMTPLSIDTRPPKPRLQYPAGHLEEVKEVMARRQSTGSIRSPTPSRPSSFFMEENPLFQSRPVSPMSTVLEPIGNVPRQRGMTLTEFTEAEKKARKKAKDAERYQQQKSQKKMGPG